MRFNDLLYHTIIMPSPRQSPFVPLPGIISALFRCPQRSRRSVPSLNTLPTQHTQHTHEWEDNTYSSFNSLWPFDHHELSHTHGQLKPRLITGIKSPSSSEYMDYTRNIVLKDKKKECSLSGGVPSICATTSQELTVVLLKHFRAVLETQGASEFAPSTLLQLRDSPAVTLAADLLFARALLFATPSRMTPPPISSSKKSLTLSELWSKSIESYGTSGSAVAEYLEPGAGLVVSLPFDLISPFARTASLLNIRSSVRFQIGRVYSSRSTSNTDGVERENGGQTPLAPLGVGVGEHPLGANEVVFDVVRGMSRGSKVDVECEVISCALNCLVALQGALPVIALRMTDSRLLDALLEVCLWPAPAVPSYSPDEVNVDIEKLLGAMSLCTDNEDNPASDDSKIPRCVQLLTELDLPPWLTRRLAPFFRLFSVQLATSSSENSGRCSQFVGNPLSVLDALEKEFYNLDVIIALQRSLAKQGHGQKAGYNDNNEWQGASAYQKKEKEDTISVERTSSGLSVGRESEKTVDPKIRIAPLTLSSVIGGIGVKGRGGAVARERERMNASINSDREKDNKGRDREHLSASSTPRTPGTVAGGKNTLKRKTEVGAKKEIALDSAAHASHAVFKPEDSARQVWNILCYSASL